MPLNKASGNMYQNWVTHTFNIIKGQCPHMCQYCYCKRWGKQSPLHFDEKELKTDLGKGNKIFVGSSCDMWAKKIPDTWILETLKVCYKRRRNQYIFQTKNPDRFLEFALPEKSIVGITAETDKFYKEYMGNTTLTANRLTSSGIYKKHKRGIYKSFITIEPIMDFDLEHFIYLIELANPDFVNIGADSGHNNLPEPSKEKTLELINELRKFTVVKIKDNLTRITGGGL